MVNSKFSCGLILINDEVGANTSCGFSKDKTKPEMRVGPQSENLDLFWAGSVSAMRPQSSKWTDDPGLAYQYTGIPVYWHTRPAITKARQVCCLQI